MLSHVAPFPRVTSSCAPVQAPWEPPAWGQCAPQACKESVQWVRPSQVRCRLYRFGGLPLKPRCVLTPSPVTSYKMPNPHWHLVASERQAEPRSVSVSGKDAPWACDSQTLHSLPTLLLSW